MNIIDKYEITLVNKVMELYSGKQIVKNINVNNIVLDEFLSDWRSAEEINELLLPDIEEVLIDPNAEIENGSETIYIFI